MMTSQNPPASPIDEGGASAYSLRLVDRLVLISFPAILVCVVLSFAETPHEGQEMKNSLYLGCGFLVLLLLALKKWIPDFYRGALYSGILVLAAGCSIIVEGLSGQGLVLCVGAFILSAVVQRWFRLFVHLSVGMCILLAAYLHTQGAFLDEPHTRGVEHYDSSPLAWVAAISTFCIAGIWTFLLGRVIDRLAKREGEALAVQQRFRCAFSSSASSMLVLIGGRIMDANRSAEDLFGRKADALKGLSLQDLSQSIQLGTELSTSMDQRLQAARAGTPQQFSWEMRNMDGEVFTALLTLMLVPYDGSDALLAVVRNVSKEHNLQKEHRMLAMAVAQAGEGIVITDVYGYIEYVNRCFEQMSGYSALEVQGSHVRILKSMKHDAEFYDEMKRCMKQGKPWQGRIINRKKDGSLYHEHLTITPLRDEQGQVLQYIAVKRDISNEVKLETQLNHAQKMEAVGQLAGGVAHDFNNMLQVVMGNVSLIGAELPEGSPARNRLDDITKASDKASGLVRQLLAFSRKNEVLVQNAEMNELVEGMSRLIERVLGADIQFSFKACTEGLPVRIDQGQVEQALLNLCVNARDAMPQGGRLTVETSLVELDEADCQQYRQCKPGFYACISVSDTGVGIPPEIRSRIFEPFFTTKEVGKGTGLGLASVYGIVQRHGGTINLYSELGVGTSFRIYFPMSMSAAGPRSLIVRQVDEGDLDGRGQTILVAEDDVQVLRVVTQILTRANYKVIGCADGEQAIDAYLRHRKQIDLVLLDVVMPRCNGRCVYDKLKEIDPELPIMFATGYSFHHLQDGLSPQVRTVQKPYNSRTLLSTLRQLQPLPADFGRS